MHAVMLSLTWPSRSYLLGVASSLATAWVVIALVAGLIRNPFVYRLVAVSAWTLAALSILGLLSPTMTALDSIGVVIGGLRVTPLLVIKTTVLLMLTLWAANAASDFLDRRVRSTADLTPSIQVLIGKLIRLLLITFAILIVLSTVGIDLLGARLLLRRGRRRPRLRPAEDRVQPGERHHPARRQVDQTGRRDLGRRSFRPGRQYGRALHLGRYPRRPRVS